MCHLLHKHQKAKTTSHKASMFCNLVLTSSTQHLQQTDSSSFVLELLRKKANWMLSCWIKECLKLHPQIELHCCSTQRLVQIFRKTLLIPELTFNFYKTQKNLSDTLALCTLKKDNLSLTIYPYHLKYATVVAFES